MIRAILFDLDGTLVDTERQTDRAIAETLAGMGIAGASLPPQQTRGRTWGDIVARLTQLYQIPTPADILERTLLEKWLELAEHAQPIPGAVEAIQQSARHFKVAIVSSSPRRVIDKFMDALGVTSEIKPELRIGAEDVRHPKPDPEGFLIAARRLSVHAAECLVFEDSSAGLRSAQAAGMAAMAVLVACAEPELCRSLAKACCQDYHRLPTSFWETLKEDKDGKWLATLK